MKCDIITQNSNKCESVQWYNAKGVAAMTHITNLEEYAQYLVKCYATYDLTQYKLTFDVLPENEKAQLTKLYIESIDREIEYACYGRDESINSSYLCALLKMLDKNDTDSMREFAEITRNNVIDHYKEKLDHILHVACEERPYYVSNDSSYFPYFEEDEVDYPWAI